MLAQQLWIIIKKKNEGTGWEKCWFRPCLMSRKTISTFRGTRQESEGLESWDWSQQSRDRCCFLWQSLTFKSAMWNWNWKLIFYAAVVTYVLLLSCAPCHTSLFCEWILGSLLTMSAGVAVVAVRENPELKEKAQNERKSHNIMRQPEVISGTQVYLSDPASSAKPRVVLMCCVSLASKLSNQNQSTVPAFPVTIRTQQLHRRRHQAARIPSCGKDGTPVRAHFAKTFPATAR